MEEAYWKQFMTTGKIEDYLQFKGVSGKEEAQDRESSYKEENPRNNPEERERWM